ncbi:MAG: hypothetical protein NZ553_01455 [Caldilinea sp.]|nr:hypothetical protein [Caldilinea sp.]MDW8439116.1 hypothetical protein [Caldilineaceae bacterium]
MNISPRERLYQLLPAIHRIRDTERGEPLRALLTIIGDELAGIEQDIDGLYDDWFIETCAEWVVPYIGDLLGVRGLHSLPEEAGFSLRAYVANTLRYRRRKGTAPVLEQLARDVTGWPCRAVEYFERLATTQHLNHVRLHSPATASLRNATALELTDGPLETVNHTVEVRNIAPGRGRYNIANIGLFLWRLQSYFIQDVTPQPVADPPDGRYRFSPLGHDAPLFNRPRTETEIAHLAEEPDLPVALRRRALYADLEALRLSPATDKPAASAYLDAGPAFQVFVPNAQGALEPIPAEEILICNLEDIPGEADWRRPPTSKSYAGESRPIRVAVDPQNGRLAFPIGVVPADLAVSYAYGFPADIGGGPYSRLETLVPDAGAEVFTATVAQRGGDYAGLADAIAAWTNAAKASGVITILDSATYVGPLLIAMAAGRSLVIQAAEGRRPLLRVQDDGAPQPWIVTGADGDGASLTLNGLWIEGGIAIQSNSLERLCVRHCTLVPGWRIDASGNPLLPMLPSIRALGPNPDFRLELERTICGALHLAADGDGLLAFDSVIDAFDAANVACAGENGSTVGPPAGFERCTVVGEVRARQLDLISESILLGRALAERRQVGCSRFSFLGEGSRAPRRHRCQPDLAWEAYAAAQGKGVDALTAAERRMIALTVTPTFAATRFGRPAYMQLSVSCPAAIAEGAEDGGEMGAFHLLQQPQRLANLRAALEEYLRVGLEAGIFLED